MGATEKKNAVPVAAKTARRKSGAPFILLMIVIGALVPFGLPTLLVCLGLLPTLVALLTDNDDRLSATITIGLLNFAGVVPFVIELWEKGQTMDTALDIMLRPLTWLVMLGAAGVGHLILYVVPYAVATLSLARQENRLRTLREGLEELTSIWGPHVATSKSLEEVRREEGK